MSAKSSIQWTDATWTPLRARLKPDALEIAEAKGYTSLAAILRRQKADGSGPFVIAGQSTGTHCEHVSEGCRYCYSEAFQKRGLPNNGTGMPFDRRSRDLFDFFVDEKILRQPLHWKQPKKIFVCSQTDLFGEWWPDEFIDRVFAVMALGQQHTFQVLTKRPERMLAYCSGNALRCDRNMPILGNHDRSAFVAFPLSNLHLGVSVEDQQTADARIPLLLRAPAAKRFVSYEPALGPVDFTSIEFRNATWYDALQDHDGWGLLGAAHPKLDQIIIGGESGPGARPFDIESARQTIRQCREAGVACFVKQLGSNPICGKPECACSVGASETCPWYRGDLRNRDRKSGDPAEWPEDLRVREDI